MSEVQVSPGDWVLFRDGYDKVGVQIAEVVKVTPKRVHLAKAVFWGPRQLNRLQVVAAFADKVLAERVRDQIGGVSGEFERRRRSAEDERSRRITEALNAASKQVERIVASAMSARQGQDPQGLGAEPASAVPEADAQGQVP